MMRYHAYQGFIRLVFIALLAGFSATASAVIESQTFDSAALETRYQSLIKELRCLVCQNQNLADSDADLAQDLRQKTADMLRAGHTDDEIRVFMQERYGDFVLYRTPLKASTLFIWLGPLLALVLGGVLFFWRLNGAAHKNSHPEEPALLDEAKQLLNRSSDS